MQNVHASYSKIKTAGQIKTDTEITSQAPIISSNALMAFVFALVPSSSGNMVTLKLIADNDGDANFSCN